jgi:hypothetical protein
MFTKSEANLLLRVPGKLPKGLKLRTEEFQKGWDLALSMDTCDLQKQLQAHSWYFVKTADGSMSCGVGDTSQQAIAGALRHALRGIGDHSNVVEMKLIELIQYPWFFLARVGVFPYRIQKDMKLPAISNASMVPIAPSCGSSLRQLAAHDSHSVSEVLMLKEMPALSRSTDEKGQ